MDELAEPTSSASRILDHEIDEILQGIRSADSRWEPGVEIALGTKRWRPPATSADGKRVLYICSRCEIPRYVKDRLLTATNNGLHVLIALNISSLFCEDVLTALAEIDASVLVLDDYVKARRFEERHFMAAIADLEVPLSPSLRKELAMKVWRKMAEGANHVKGRRLEAFLAFLFSQVSDLRVVERNYRNETEEIDLVLQVDNFSNRVWQKSGVPFILVEAKNTLDKASQSMVSILLTKLKTKRGTSRIGIMVSIGGFTEDARLQELRFSTDEICIPMIDKSRIEQLFESDDIESDLETIIRRAMLR